MKKGVYSPYPHEYPSVRDYLISERNISIIHLVRRNLLRRYLSYRRALEIGDWRRLAGSAGVPPRAVRLDPHECFRDFLSTEAQRVRYARHFEQHEVREVYYEDLAEDPRGVGAQVVEFLGLTPRDDLEITEEKIGGASMRDSILDYDEFRSEFEAELEARKQRWMSFFED